MLIFGVLGGGCHHCPWENQAKIFWKAKTKLPMCGRWMTCMFACGQP